MNKPKTKKEIMRIIREAERTCEFSCPYVKVLVGIIRELIERKEKWN